MKKLTMIAVMAAMAATAFAQDDLVKQAQKLSSKGEFEEAIKTITPALTSDQTLDKAAAWNAYSNIQYGYFAHLDQIGTEYQVKHSGPQCDSLLMYNCVVKAYEAAVKCDEYDQLPNEKGKVKIRFRKANQERFTNGRLQLIFAGDYFYKQKKNDDAQKAWGLYVESAESSLFTGVDLSDDSNRSLIAYYAGLISYQNKDYVNAERYAKIAAQDPERTGEANEILLFAKKDGAKTKEDSLAYAATLKELHAQNPGEERYTNLLNDYYAKAGDTEAFLQWLNEELSVNPNNKLMWLQKGYLEMNANKWEESVASYDKAIAIDPDYKEAYFNKGACLYNKAREMQNSLADSNGSITNENMEKVKAELVPAKDALEKMKELDPSNELRWAYTLYNIYYILGDKDNVADMEAKYPEAVQN